MSRASSPRCIVFLGPSLPVAEARALLPADYRPPARQGDVFRALEERPDALVLIDGVFESVPSVWHHELLAAHASGVRLFGASSMGALRAAELPGVMRPLGEIARRFARGTWNDDAAVTLLHGDESSAYRALTVSWVNVFATARQARQRGVLSPREAKALVAEAERQFYQARTWRTLFEALGWREPRRAAVLAERVDLKAADARVALSTVARLAPRAGRPAPLPLSSFVRRSRLPPPAGGPHGHDGVRTLLVADFARQAGLTADPRRVRAHRQRLAGPFALDQLEAWAEALALEELVLGAPERFVPDGPSGAEGTALLRALGRP
jgi:hypothetical protein